MKNNLTELKAKYEEVKEKIDKEKSTGDFRETFDETFDNFFDQKEIRKKYDAWDDEEDLPNFDISNGELEEKLDDEDLNALCIFYLHYIDMLEEELDELRDLVSEEKLDY